MTGDGSADNANRAADVALAFGPFQLFPARQLLLRDGEAVSLGSRAFALLVALVDNAGEFVRKDQLIARVWPDTFVEEANRRLQT